MGAMPGRKAQRHLSGQIVMLLGRANAYLVGGGTVADAYRDLQVPDATYYRSRKLQVGHEGRGGQEAEVVGEIECYVEASVGQGGAGESSSEEVG